MEFDGTGWSCPYNSDQNCTQNPAKRCRGGVECGGLGGLGGLGVCEVRVLGVWGSKGCGI